MKPPHHLLSIYVETYRSIVLRGATTPQKCLQVTIVWGHDHTTRQSIQACEPGYWCSGGVRRLCSLLDDIVFQEVAQKSVMGCARGVSVRCRQF